jgi:hypothetical protein
MILETSNWLPYYKLNEEGQRAMTQQTYEPLISPDKKTFCANYSYNNAYQHRQGYTKEVVDWFFENEIKHFLKFQNQSWCPEIIDIDRAKLKIFFKWQGDTCNEIIYNGKQLQDYCPDWKNQLQCIMTDCYDLGTYKLTMYPHCHYIYNGQLKTFDMYGCVDIASPWIPKYAMDGIVHETARFRLDETDSNDTHYNLEKMFKRSMSTHVKWGNEDLNWLYIKMFGYENA